MKPFGFLLLLFFFLVRQSVAQGFIEYRPVLDGQHAIPPNSSPRHATVGSLLYDYGSFGAAVYLVDNSNVTGVSLFESTSANQLGTHLVDLDYQGYVQGINGSGSAFVWGYSTILPPDQMAKVRDGDWWLVVFSTDYPNGELRGQITAVPEPGTVALLIIGGLGLFMLRSKRSTSKHAAAN